jgi:hypothetical protein
VDGKLRFFQKLWKPHCWKAPYRFLFIRQEVRVQQKGPIQLEPVLKFGGVLGRGILAAAKAAKPEHPRSGL